MMTPRLVVLYPLAKIRYKKAGITKNILNKDSRIPNHCFVATFINEHLQFKLIADTVLLKTKSYFWNDRIWTIPLTIDYIALPESVNNWKKGDLLIDSNRTSSMLALEK